jgi:hypothetical protein
MTGATTVFTDVTAPPATITVSSSAGGTDSDNVTGTGPGLAPISVQAFAGADATVQQGQSVTLDGTESTGEVASYAWTQVAGTPVTLTGADTAKPTFTAPSTSGPLSFTLTVNGPGGPSSDTVDLTVADVVAPVAAAGPDQAVVRGAKVTLNGAASTGVNSYQWKQVQATGDPAVTLTGANTATPSFTFPASDNPLTFQLTVTGPGGSSTDSVSVAPKSDALTATARYRTGGREWIISGTATLLSPANTVTVHNGRTLSGPVIGSPAAVDAVDGTWKVRVKPSAVAPDATRTISIESKLGGVRLAIPVNVTS